MLTQPVINHTSLVATENETSDKESSETETFRACVVLITGGEESEFRYPPSSQVLLIT